MSLPSPINWLHIGAAQFLPDHIWVVRERTSYQSEWDNPANTWWVQPDYYPDTPAGFGLAWRKVYSLLKDSGLEMNTEIVMTAYPSPLAEALGVEDSISMDRPYNFNPEGFENMFRNLKDYFNPKTTKDWKDIPLHKLTSEIFWWKDNSVIARLDRANLPYTIRELLGRT